MGTGRAIFVYEEREQLLLPSSDVFLTYLPLNNHAADMTAIANHTLDSLGSNGYGRCCGPSVWMSAAQDERRVVSFLLKPMGQYFAAVNKDKKEFVCPWCIGGGAKLWEWAANPMGGVFVLLLRQSSGGGGGDFYDPLPRPRRVDVGGKTPAQAASCVMDSIAICAAAEGAPITPAEDAIVGRWAGDCVALVGDYDESRLWEELYRTKTYRNISQELVEVWNDFIELSDYQLSFNPQCSCRASE